jgi:hypothetical protein
MRRAESVVLLLLAALAPLGSAHASPGAIRDHDAPRARADAVASTTRDGWLRPNALRLAISNQGQFALDHDGYNAGLEYPQSSGKFAAYAGGLWITGAIPGDTLAAIAEFGSDFVPGDMEGGAAVTDTARFRVFSVNPYDTTGRSAWMGIAAPLGAPTANGGATPLLLGDQTVWTVFNDASPTPESPPQGGSRLSAPIGLEVRLTAWSFHRDGPLDRVAYLSYQIIDRGSTRLDGARIGMFFDPHVGSGPQLAACDTSLDLGYAFHQGSDVYYGAAGPAVGLAILDPPRDPVSEAALRASAFIAYANGTDPNSVRQMTDVMAGRLPSGTAIVDSSTLQVTTFFSSGDPVSGSGWVQGYPTHPHTVLSMGPCSISPGDTIQFVVALAVGQGTDALSGVTDLRAVVREAKRDWAAGFTDLPPNVYRPLIAWPNPSSATATFSYSVGAAPQPVEITVYDLTGRRIRSYPSRVENPGSHQAGWDGNSDDGRRAPSGLYLVRARVGGSENVARVTLIR